MWNKKTSGWSLDNLNDLKMLGIYIDAKNELITLKFICK